MPAEYVAKQGKRVGMAIALFRCVRPLNWAGEQYMATVPNSTDPTKTKSSRAFNYSYVVLAILMLLTIGATIVFYEISTQFDNEAGEFWTPAVFLIGLCISLLIFGVTYREIAARAVLQQKTLDLIDAQNQNERLLAAEQASRIAAEQANLAKDEFLAIVSHELRTPLNAIAGWNRILKTHGISDETKKTAVEKIDKNLRLQAAIVDELLSFSDIMSSGSSISTSAIPVRSLFEEAVASANSAAQQKGVTLVDKDTLDTECVLGDRHKLKLAVTNVLMNAVKFTPPGGNIDVRAFRDDGTIKLVVEDSGIGMEPEVIRHIFDEYRQSEHATTRQFGGLGLGLTVAEHIVRMHSGTIDAFSPGTGKGSTFTITLPSTDRIVH